ncbi:unnamed protein product [Amoebophrya sp. A120]|nr:unnamed protein product [Amoebophrya sp. A120]|eukprot:GSA120T00009862001.1
MKANNISEHLATRFFPTFFPSGSTAAGSPWSDVFHSSSTAINHDEDLHGLTLRDWYHEEIVLKPNHRKTAFFTKLHRHDRAGIKTASSSTSFAALNPAALLKNIKDVFVSSSNQEEDCLEHCLGKESEARPNCSRCDGIQARQDEKLGPGEPEMEAVDTELEPPPEQPVEEPVEETGGNNPEEGGNTPKGDPEDNELATSPPLSPPTDHTSLFKCFANAYLERGPVKQFKWDYDQNNCKSMNNHNLQSDCAVIERTNAEKLCATTPLCGGITGKDGIWYLRDGRGKVREFSAPVGENARLGNGSFNYCLKKSLVEEKKPHAEFPWLGMNDFAVEG